MPAKAGKVIFRRIRGRLIPIRVNKSKSRRDVGDQLQRIKQKKTRLARMDKAIDKEFGYTDFSEEAGYIDRKARMIDFSERKQGGGGQRSLDHRSIERVFESKKAKNRSENMFHFMKETDSIRMSDNGTDISFDMVKKPSSRQINQMKRIARRKETIFADHTELSGDVKKSGTFGSVDEMIRSLFGDD